MRKLIILIFIVGFVGSASAADVTYHFTADINSYEDGSGAFSELGYSGNMTLTGTITIDTEAALLFPCPDPYAAGVWGYWKTGVIRFENQGYTWLDTVNRTLYVINDSTVPYHQTKIMTNQNNLEGVSNVTTVIQTITMTNDGLDASMPADLNLGSFSEYIVKIAKSGVPASKLTATITSLMNAEEYAASQVQPAAGDDMAVLKRKIEKAKQKLNDGNSNNDNGAFSELMACNRQVEKLKVEGKLTTHEYNECKDMLNQSVAITQRVKGKK